MQDASLIQVPEYDFGLAYPSIRSENFKINHHFWQPIYETLKAMDAWEGWPGSDHIEDEFKEATQPISLLAASHRARQKEEQKREMY